MRSKLLCVTVEIFVVLELNGNVIRENATNGFELKRVKKIEMAFCAGFLAF